MPIFKNQKFSKNSQKGVPKMSKIQNFIFFEKLMQNLGSPWSFWLESIPNMHFCKKFGGQPPKKDPLQPKLKELQKNLFLQKCVKSIFRKSQEISDL